MAKKIGLDTSKKKNENIIDTLTKQVQQKKASQLLGSQPVKERGTQAGEITKNYISSMNRGSANTPLVSGINERKTSDIFDTLLNGKSGAASSASSNTGRPKTTNLEFNQQNAQKLDILLTGNRKEDNYSTVNRTETGKKDITENDKKKQETPRSIEAQNGITDSSLLRNGQRSNLLEMVSPKGSAKKTGEDTGVRASQGAGRKPEAPMGNNLQSLAETVRLNAEKNSGKQEEEKQAEESIQTLPGNDIISRLIGGGTLAKANQTAGNINPADQEQKDDRLSRENPREHAEGSALEIYLRRDADQLKKTDERYDAQTAGNGPGDKTEKSAMGPDPYAKMDMNSLKKRNLNTDYYRGEMPETLSADRATEYWGTKEELRRSGEFDPEEGDTQGLMLGDYRRFSQNGRGRARSEWKEYIPNAQGMIDILNAPVNYTYATGLSEDGNEVTEDMLAGWKSDTWNRIVAERYPGKTSFNTSPGLLWFMKNTGDDLTVHFEDAQQEWVLRSFYDTINGEGAYQRAINLMDSSEKTAFDGKILRAVAASGLIDSDDKTAGLQGSIDFANERLSELDYWDKNDAEYDRIQPGATVDGYDQLHAERKLLLDERNSLNPSDPRREELDQRLAVVNKNINDIAEYNAESRSIMERDDISGTFNPDLDVENANSYNLMWFENANNNTGTPQEIYSFVGGGKVRQAYDANAGGEVSPFMHYAMMMTPQEKEKFMRMYESETDPDKPKTMAYLNGLQPFLTRRYSEWKGAWNREFSEENPIMATGVGSIINFFAPVTEAARRIAGDFGDKSVNDPFGNWFEGQQFIRDSESTIIKNIREKYGDLAVFGYQTGKSMLDDSLRQVATMGLASLGFIDPSAMEATSIVWAGAQAYQTKFYETMLQTNGDVEKSTIAAYLDAAVEMGTEVYSAGVIFGEGNSIPTKVYIASLSEALEEVAGGTVKPYLERMLYGKSEYDRQADEIWTISQMNGGVYYDENGQPVKISNRNAAYNYMVDNIWIPDILNSAGSALFSGGAEALAVEGFNSIHRARTGQSILRGRDFNGEKIRNGSGKTSIALETVLTVGENMGEDTESKQRADNLRTRIRDGEKLRARDVGKLVESIYVEGSAETAKESERIYADVIASELKEKGVEEERAKAASELIAKARVEGTEALTKAEKQQLMQDETAYQTYLALLKNENASAEGKAIAEKAEKSASEVPTIAEKIEGTQMSIGMQRRLKYLNEQVRADSVSKEAQMATDKQLKTAIGNRTGTAADVVVGNRIGQVTGFKEDAKTGEILATVQFDDGTEDVGLSEVYGTDSNVAGLVKYAQVFKGSMTPEYLTAAVRTAQELGENINDKYLAEAERISMAAWFGESMPTVSMDKTAAENLYKIAQAEQQAAEDRRTQNPAQALNPGKGRSVFNGVEYGSKGWKAELNKLPENIRKNDINVLAELNRRLGFDLVFINNPNDTDMFGYENGNTGRITVNLAAMNANEKGRSYLTIAGHEFTHWLQNNSKAGYASLRNFIIKSYRQEGKSVENMVLDKLASYQSGLKARAEEETAALREKDQNAEAVRPQRFVLEDAIYEVIAEASDQVLASDEMAKRLQAEDPNLYGKFKKFVKNFFSNLKQAIGYMRDSGSISRESAALMREEIREGIAKHWLAAYDEAMGVERPTEFAAGEEGKINYSQADIDYEEAVRNGEGDAYALAEDMASAYGEETHYGDRRSFSMNVKDPEKLKWLDGQETITTYKSFQEIDGKLYPPMALIVDGEMEDPAILGQWREATEHPELIKKGNKFNLNKGKGLGNVPAAYNPYEHSSNLMINDQFTTAYKRPNLVTVECEVPVSELTSGYHADLAKDSVGWHEWKSGPVGRDLKKQSGQERNVMLSRWIKPVRIIPNSEVAQHYAKLLNGTDIAVPDNVVTPDLLNELKKAGVKIQGSKELGTENQQQNKRYSFMSSYGNVVTMSEEDISKNRDYVATMQSIGEVSGKDFPKVEGSPISERMINYFNNEGNIVENDIIGEIEIERRGAEHFRRHMNGQSAAVIPLIKTVLKNGKIVDIDPAHKGTVPSIVLAGTVKIDGIPYYMGVAVRRINNNSNRYYMHNVIMVNKKNGNQLNLNGRASVTTTVEPTTTDNHSIYSILLDIRKRNAKSGNNNTDTNSYSFQQADNAYMKAVEAEDTETMQSMVDEAAKAAGYNIEGYHGTDAHFNEFKIGDIGFHIGSYEQANDRMKQAGMRSTQANRAENIMHLYAKLENPLVIDHDFGDWHGKNVAEMLLETEQWEEGYDENAEEINARLAEIAKMPDGKYTDKVMREYLQSLGYDGIDYENQYENVDRDEYGWAEEFERSYIVFESNQLKSADPVVYDDEGNIIPPSERFNPEKTDIRYSIGGSEITNSEGDVMAEQLPSGNITAYSLRTVNDTVDDELIRQLVAKGFGEKKVKKWVKDVFSVARYIADNRQRLDYQEGPGTMLKNNAEYVKTLDASTLCAKRLLYQGIFNEIQKMLPNTPLLPDDLIKLQNMMRKAGLVTPCSFCYVESRRKMLGAYAEKWIKEYDGAYKPTIAEVTTTDGLEGLRTSEDPAKQKAYDDFVEAMNAKGSANPKVVQLRTDYKGEIKNLTDKQIEKVKSIGGLRVQSFSDFEVVHMLDMMQAVMDMAAKDLTSQAYTKVPAFAWVFGDTGIKINLSLVGKGTGLDANGNLVFDNVEGMDIDEAMKLREAYSKNVGTILVGINEDHIIAAMGDDRIDFIIPFHKSGWSKREMGLITEMASYKDHTRWQNEKKIESVSKDGKIKTIPNKKSKITNFEPVGPNGYWDFSKTGQQNAEHYLEMCKEDGRVPKFSQFLVNNGDGSFSLPQGNDQRSENIRKGYWKLLIDFKMYDNAGKGSPQTEVTPKFNMEQAMKIMETYDGPTNELPTNHKLAQQFAEEYKAEHPRKSYSIKNPGDLDVNQWMKTVTPGMLRTPAERKLVADYRGLRTKIELETKKQSDYKNKLAVIEAKEDPTQSEKRQAEGLRMRIKNSQAIQQDYENKLYEITGSEGYATMMYNQSKIMDSFLNGKTEAQVRDSVEAMQRQNTEAQKKIDKLSAELKELAGSKEVRRVRALMNQDKLNELAKKLRTDYNSTMDRQELTDELAMIRLKMQRGQDATADVENLAGRIVDDMRPNADPTLTQMRGMTIQVTPEQLKELKGRGESMKTIRSKLAGTGIKVEQGSVNTLVDNLSDLQERFGADLDFGGEKDALSNFADWVENRKQGSTETREQYRQNMADVMSDVYGAIAQVELNLPKDKATRDQFEQLFRYVEEVAKQAEKGAEIMDGMKTAMREAIESGKSAAAWTESLRNDVDATIDYFNKTAQLAEETAQSRHVQQVIEQLKSKHVEEMIKRNEQWRNMIERDRNARIQNEANNAKRRIITTDATRLMKLLVSPKGEKVVPEHMNGMARKLIELLVDNDLLGGRKITDIEKRNLFEYKRILNGWNQRDGRFNIDDLQLGDDNLTELVKEDLAYIEDKLKEWNDRYYGKNKLDTLEKRGSTLEQLQEAISEIYSIIKQEQSIEIGDRRVLVADQAYKVQQAIAGRKFREWNGKAGKVIAALHKGIVSGNMTPEYFFRTLRNEGMWDLWEEYHKAENRNGLELARSKNRLAEIAEKHGYRSWDMGKRMTLEMANGDKVSMTIGQLMSLYATWNREQQLGPEMSNHLKKGGFFVDESDPNRGIISRVMNEKRAHRVTEADMDKVNNLLTEEQKQFVYDVVQYMSNEMSDLGNEASMKAYGIKMYKEKYYFPFKIWDGVKSRKSNDAGNGANIDRAFHPSFSKARTHNAGNALILGDFMQTAADHIAGMINYATMGLANETMQKVLNFREQQDGSEETEQTARNIRAMLEEAYGRTAMNYLEDLKTQLNGGAVRIDRTFYDKLISLFRKNAVAGSLSVAAQQPLSYIRAAMLIDPKYLARALAPDMWRGSYKEMMEHSGVAVIKEMGRFDMNAGQSAREYLMPDGYKGKGKAAYDKAVELATMLPERMDRMTWTRMWSAVKAEQKALNPEMDPKSEAFLNKVAVRFNEVMRRTQVYDSVLVRSRNMRNQNPAVKGITSFMAEPTLTLNVLADSARMAIQGEKGGKKMAAMAGATFMLSGIMQSVIKAIFSAGRTPDEKKTLLENFLYRLETNLISELNPLSMIPGYSDLVNILEKGKIEDDALGVIGKMISAGETAIDLMLGKSDKSAHRAIEDSAGQLVQIFTGVPLKNIMRDGRAIYNWISGAPYADRPTNPNVLKYQAEAGLVSADNILGAINAKLGEAGFMTTNKAYYNRIYEAKKAGDEGTAAGLTDYLMTAKGVKESAITSGVKSAAKADERATMSEKAEIIRSAGGDPNDYVMDQLKDGELDEGEALTILKEQNPDTDENDLWWKVDRASYYRDTGTSPGGNAYYYRMYDAIDANDSTAIKTAVRDMTAHGRTNKQVQDQIRDKYKKQYLELPNGREKIALKNALIMAYKATGMTEAEAEATINGWKAK